MGGKLAFGDDSESSDEEQFNLTINDKYAKKYETRKKGEELSKLKEKYDSDDDSSSNGEVEDSDGELITPEIDAQIMKTIALIKSKSERVYDAKKEFFSADEINKAKESWEAKQADIKGKGKAVHLKDYHRERLLNGKSLDGEEEQVSNKGMSHVQEQEFLKNQLKDAIKELSSDEDEGDDFLKVREKDQKTIAQEEEEYKQFLLDSVTQENPELATQLQKPEDEGESFLMNFVMSKGWIDKDSKSKIPTYSEIIDEDEKELDQVDDFERKYNFRFEEEGGTHIQTHSRNILNTTRRPDDRRKIARTKSLATKSEKKTKKLEELKRLKNLKRAEIMSKLEQINKLSGTKNEEIKKMFEDGEGEEFVDPFDLDGEFDERTYDEKMGGYFDDGYYEHKEDKSALEKPDFGADINIDDILSYEKKEEEQLKLLRKKPLPEPEEEIEEPYIEEEPPIQITNPEDEFIMDADYLPGGDKYGMEPPSKKNKKEKKGKKNKKNQKQQQQTEQGEQGEGNVDKETFDKYLDEYYRLDYEDMIGDLPTRFKYVQVEKNNFGLDPAEILLAQDSELNQLYSLKKLAPFRKAEAVARDVAKFQKSKKKRIREFRKGLVDQIEEVIQDEEKVEKEVRGVVGNWLKGIKSKREDGMTEGNLEQMKEKEKRDKKRKRAAYFLETKQGGKKNDGEPAKKKKMSDDRLASYQVKSKK